MPDIFAGFDILGVGTLLGSLLFLGGLVWLLVDNRSFDEVNRRHAAKAERERPIPAPPAATDDMAATAMAAAAEGPAQSQRTDRAGSGRGFSRPSHPGRVA